MSKNRSPREEFKPCRLYEQIRGGECVDVEHIYFWSQKWKQNISPPLALVQSFCAFDPPEHYFPCENATSFWAAPIEHVCDFSFHFFCDCSNLAVRKRKDTNNTFF